MSGLVVEAGSGLMQFHCTWNHSRKEPIDVIFWVSGPVRVKIPCGCEKYYEVDPELLLQDMGNIPRPSNRRRICACSGHLIE